MTSQVVHLWRTLKSSNEPVLCLTSFLIKIILLWNPNLNWIIKQWKMKKYFLKQGVEQTLWLRALVTSDTLWVDSGEHKPLFQNLSNFFISPGFWKTSIRGRKLHLNPKLSLRKVWGCRRWGLFRFPWILEGRGGAVCCSCWGVCPWKVSAAAFQGLGGNEKQLEILVEKGL